MENEPMDAQFFFSSSYKVEGAKQYARILLKRARTVPLTSINGEYFAYRIYRLRSTAISKTSRGFHNFTTATTKVMRNNQLGAQLYLLQRTTFEIQQHVYAQWHNSWTNSSECNFGDVAYPYQTASLNTRCDTHSGDRAVSIKYAISIKLFYVNLRRLFRMHAS